MKRKIIYLLVAVLCLAVLLPSCDQGETTETVNCTGHADVDANLSCDNCGTPIHTIVNSVPAEQEEIPTAFAEIPDNATINNLFNTSFTDDNQILSTNITESDRWFTENSYTHGIDDMGYGIYRVTYTVVNNSDPENVHVTKHLMLYNANIAKAVYSTYISYYQESTPDKSYSVSVIDAYGVPCAFKVTIGTYDYSYGEYYYSYSVYTLDGTPIATELDEASAYAYQLSGGQAVLNISDTLYVIENNKVITTYDADTFVDRPAFTFVNEEKNLGYVVSYNNPAVLVYELSSWINCVWSYEIPSCYDYDVFFLANGNILIQTKTMVPAGSVNYDYTNGNTNYDLDYFVVDVNTRATTEIEFGYYIRSVDVANKDTDGSAVKNWLTVNNIVNKNVASDSMVLAAGDDLTVIGEKSATLPSVLVQDFELVANNTFLATIYYGEGTTVRKLYDANGAEIAILPNNAVIKGNYILLNKTMYDFQMNPVYTLTEKQSIYAAFDTYMIVYDQGDSEAEIPAGYFYVSASNGNPVQITSENSVIVEFSSDYFVIKTMEDEAQLYKIYNENGQLVYTSSNSIYNIFNGEGVFTIVFDNGQVVIAQ